MKTEKYYTSEKLESMTADQLRELVENQQIQLQTLRWNMNGIKELLIAAIQSLPKTMES